MMLAWARDIVIEIDGENCLYSELISKVESEGFADEVDVG